MPEVLHVYYDTRLAPLTFDFASYLVVANAERQVRGFGSIALHIQRPAFRNRTIREATYDEGTKEWRFRHIILSLSNLLSSVSSVEWTKHGPNSIVFPSYPPTYPPRSAQEAVNCIPYLSNALFNYRDTNADLLPYSAKPYATDVALSLLGLSKTDDIITISLRTSNQQIERNSCIEAWFEVYSELVNRGYKVFVIPDFEDVSDKKIYLRYPWKAFLPAVFDMEIRLAIYSISVMNLGVLNGVLVPLFHSRYPYVIFKPNVESIHQTTKRWLKDVFGVQPGESFWWSGGRQKLSWESDENAETIIKNINHFLL